MRNAVNKGDFVYCDEPTGYQGFGMVLGRHRGSEAAYCIMRSLTGDPKWGVRTTVHEKFLRRAHWSFSGPL